MHPNNTQMDFMICVKPGMTALVGQTFARASNQSPPDGFMWCDGNHLQIKDYEDLFKVLGHAYTVRFIAVDRKKNFLQKLFRIKPTKDILGHPGYEEGTFGLPDLRSKFVEKK